ncbi:hypothetical protein GCM10011588_70100 [Nocardia jinanensis]|uniref:Uncharacterized protein n=1 Tax=Nocardia jinanensis TaxID=382504 RepID=A0A917RZK3_9NOCA|nr:hypothetical protein GCM10011588_70100 [Nocardia jinanensis]
MQSAEAAAKAKVSHHHTLPRHDDIRSAEAAAKAKVSHHHTLPRHDDIRSAEAAAKAKVSHHDVASLRTRRADGTVRERPRLPAAYC